MGRGGGDVDIANDFVSTTTVVDENAFGIATLPTGRLDDDEWGEGGRGGVGRDDDDDDE